MPKTPTYSFDFRSADNAVACSRYKVTRECKTLNRMDRTAPCNATLNSVMLYCYLCTSGQFVSHKHSGGIVLSEQPSSVLLQL